MRLHVFCVAMDVVGEEQEKKLRPPIAPLWRNPLRLRLLLRTLYGTRSSEQHKGLVITSQSHAEQLQCHSIEETCRS